MYGSKKEKGLYAEEMGLNRFNTSANLRKTVVAFYSL